jgi:hypothetical protein
LDTNSNISHLPLPLPHMGEGEGEERNIGHERCGWMKDVKFLKLIINFVIKFKLYFSFFIIFILFN